MTTTFEVEGHHPVAPWSVRAGMLVVQTDWDHEQQHLHLILRPEKQEPRPITHWTNVKETP